MGNDLCLYSLEGNDLAALGGSGRTKRAKRKAFKRHALLFSLLNPLLYSAHYRGTLKVGIRA